MQIDCGFGSTLHDQISDAMLDDPCHGHAVQVVSALLYADSAAPNPDLGRQHATSHVLYTVWAGDVLEHFDGIGEYGSDEHGVDEDDSDEFGSDDVRDANDEAGLPH